MERPDHFIAYSYSIAIQLLIIWVANYFGHRLTSKNAELLSAAYESTWCDQNREFRKNILIMMEYSKRNMQFRVVGFEIELSLKQFIEVCNATYSFYTVLLQLQNQLNM
jgi:hypothetical protein